MGNVKTDDSMMMYYILGAVGLALLGGGIWFFLSKRSAPDPAKFFKAKGKMQKNFWDMAEADAENFKYAAYRFPTMEAARAALLNLSYMREDHGQVKCKADILYGTYPHQDKAVSFLGGPLLGYAMWREATALWPELPGAEYFRVSTAPEVKLDVPDIQALMADKDIDITFVERREADDFTMHHIYKAPDEKSAMTFLDKVEIKSPDVNIIVETPDMVYRKNMGGMITYKPGEEPPSAKPEDVLAGVDDGEVGDAMDDALAEADAGTPDEPVKADGAKENDGDEKKKA